MSEKMFRKASIVAFAALATFGLASRGYGQERAPCPQIRHIDIDMERERYDVKMRFETENRQEYPVDAEVRVYWAASVAVRALPQFGGKISTDYRTRLDKLEITADPGRQRHEESHRLSTNYSEGTLGAVGRSLESMSPPMGAETKTIRVYPNQSNSDGFQVVKCRRG